MVKLPPLAIDTIDAISTIADKISMPIDLADKSANNGNCNLPNFSLFWYIHKKMKRFSIQ